MTISAGGRVARKERNFARDRRSLSLTRPGSSEIETWKTFLASSTPIVVEFSMDSSFRMEQQ